MEVQLQVLAKVDKPCRVGNVGTVVARKPNARGEQILEFTFSRALMNKITRRSLMGRQRLVDKSKKLPDTDRQQPE